MAPQGALILDLKQLDYYVRVAELGSFTKAAALLSVAQSALSHQVRQLEIEFRQPLLHRNGRGVTPTDAGNRLLAHARGILTQVDRARDELADQRGAPVGHLVIGLPATIARLLTVPVFKSFQAAFPKATFGMVEGLSAAIVDWVATGRADVGLIFDPIPSPSLDLIPLHQQEMFLISAKEDKPRPGGRAVRMQDLPRYPLIVPSRLNANRRRIESQFADLGLRATVAHEIDGIASILDLVHEGYGHAILPLSSLRGHSLAAELDIRPIVNPKLTIQLAFVVSSQRPTTPLTREAVGLIHSIALGLLTAKPA
jgi:LysR family nitrogen assimilation transcriptional regulator